MSGPDDAADIGRLMGKVPGCSEAEVEREFARVAAKWGQDFGHLPLRDQLPKALVMLSVALISVRKLLGEEVP